MIALDLARGSATNDVELTAAPIAGVATVAGEVVFRLVDGNVVVLAIAGETLQIARVIDVQRDPRDAVLPSITTPRGLLIPVGEATIAGPRTRLLSLADRALALHAEVDLAARVAAANGALVAMSDGERTVVSVDLPTGSHRFSCPPANALFPGSISELHWQAPGSFPACNAAHGAADAPTLSAPWFHDLQAMARELLTRTRTVTAEVVALPRVLIVDDEENQRRTLSIGLKLDGFEVSVAGSAADALRRLAAPPPIDLTMIDLMMPGLNGLELARQIRRLYPTVRVVLSSAYHLSARQVERADCGAVGFVPKPYRLDELCSFLRSKAKPTSPPPV